MALDIGIGQRNPLHLVGHGVSLLLCAWRRDEDGRRVAVVGIRADGEGTKSVEHLLADGDVVELTGRSGTVRRLQVRHTPGGQVGVRMTEIDDEVTAAA